MQSNHIHLICEGKDREALARGLQGLFVRIARGINRHLGRSGRVFEDRYHDHVLKTPSEVRNALIYVLHNTKHHRVARRASRRGGPWLDPSSSALMFYGLEEDRAFPWARTWLLREGWQRAGPISPDAMPASRHTR